MNGGQCVEDASASNGFKCRCAAGYEGQACERDTDECLSAPCMHQGRCVDGVNSFTCTCATGYSGRLCEVDERPCRPGVCQNGGTCAVNDEGDSECFCSIGFSGTDCSTEVGKCLKRNRIFIKVSLKVFFNINSLNFEFQGFHSFNISFLIFACHTR